MYVRVCAIVCVSRIAICLIENAQTKRSYRVLGMEGYGLKWKECYIQTEHHRDENGWKTKIM